MTNLIQILDGAIFLLPVIGAVVYLSTITYRSIGARFA
jgi:hypothetical protein